MVGAQEASDTRVCRASLSVKTWCGVSYCFFLMILRSSVSHDVLVKRFALSHSSNT